MENTEQVLRVPIKLGSSPLTKFILMFSDKMDVLDSICNEMSRIIGEIDARELELEAMFDDLYRRSQQTPSCPSLRCNCWTLAPVTKRFLDIFKDMRIHKGEFRALRERACLYIDELKDEDPESINKPLDLTNKDKRD